MPLCADILVKEACVLPYAERAKLVDALLATLDQTSEDDCDASHGWLLLLDVDVGQEHGRHECVCIDSARLQVCDGRLELDALFFVER